MRQNKERKEIMKQKIVILRAGDIGPSNRNGSFCFKFERMTVL